MTESFQGFSFVRNKMFVEHLIYSLKHSSCLIICKCCWLLSSSLSYTFWEILLWEVIWSYSLKKSHLITLQAFYITFLKEISVKWKLFKDHKITNVFVCIIACKSKRKLIVSGTLTIQTSLFGRTTCNFFWWFR